MTFTDYMDTMAKLIKETREVEDKIQLGGTDGLHSSNIKHEQ